MSPRNPDGWLAKLEIWREKTDWLPPLLARFVLGVVFIQSGWGKLHNLSNVVEFFKTLGIPAPAIQAPFVAGVEFFGGILVLVGLLTPLAAFLLACTMVVAILTARLGDVHSIGGLANLAEVSFLVMLLWLVWEGAGKVSVDYLWRRRKA